MSVSFSVLAVNTSPSVFYPLPVQAQGNFLAAKNLYLGAGGGLWIHDVHGKVLFYDGRTLLPRKGSLLQFSSEKVAFLNDEFWSFFDNEVYRHTPGIGNELAFSLSPGAEIVNIGVSGDYIWVTDGSNFYTYNTQSLEFNTYSLLKLYRYNNSSDIVINDAERVLSKWVLATSSGVYLSENQEFTHIAASDKHHIETVYFSNTRRELIIGTLNGAVIVDLADPDKEIFVRGSHVLSLAETSDQYWIGTEHGLVSYNFITGQVTRFDQAANQDFSLPGEKIYSLINDHAGGMWVATNNGIRYFSLFSKTFSRTPLTGMGMHSSSVVINRIQPVNDNLSWVASSMGLYLVDSQSEAPPVRVYQKPVKDLEVFDTSIWLATKDGIISINTNTLELQELNLPRAVEGIHIENFALQADNVLWMSSGQNLYSLLLGTMALTSYGTDWLVDKFLPAKITDLNMGLQGSLYIGTDHGFYSFIDKRISFSRLSERFGKVVDIEQTKDGAQWFAGSYGVYRMPHDTNVIEEVALIEDNISPNCLISDDNGVWLGSSKGVSYYGLDGQLLKHIGSPFGLITNELTAGACALFYSDENQSSRLVLGSKYGVVTALSNELLVSTTPHSRALLSKISVDQQTVSLGGKTVDLEEVPYGSSIGFKLGILPATFAPAMEYRLTDDEPWSEFEGGLLTLDHLLPGDYTLEVKPVKDSHYRFVSTTQSFSIAEPWYLSNWAVASSLTMLIGLVTVLVFWRSRYVTFANRHLKAQVALKTDQLRHQSRILLTTNQQLKKQLLVKNVLVSHTAKELSDEVTQIAAMLPSWNDDQGQSPILTLKNGLAQLTNSQEGSETVCCDVILVLESVLKAWKGDLAKAGIELDINVETKHRHVSLLYFNLDIIFNSLVASIIKRNFKSQSMVVLVEEVEEHLVVTIRDHGMPFPKLASSINESNGKSTDLNIEKLPLLINQSGGELNAFVSDSQNKVQLSWPIEYQVLDDLEASTIEQIETIKLAASSPEQQKLTAEQEWKNKVSQLVSEHYADAEFGTATAAKYLFMSERSLQRRFKSAYNKTFKEHLNQVRLEHACERLLAGEKVSDVAFDSGFNDPSYFSQRFKHHFGMSPSKFAENNEE
ncbi:helix-turn-helix domain-containing protein [Vibrio cyclitrophicus]|uniref:AraC family transcriptional regulator n=1 Tax=Vibrio cyclitrophicus TaxID=47951 RepID=UPI000C854429|nr:AraC family transcriptional regulator [Vibrio cyclitrophicus]PME92924.1 AraC family transcriptional regulator [Vibrio cyclitrophicus]PMF57065.1 AraC family transcriptional regulator [Vibrio cyclitrophicus]PMF59181.1 AraC family transcriptional regulator [Vibrio cyclitrophicus]PMI68467.1 AraC family transcriptional regulator [Vibrio cyclitrophicus]PMJ80259.1 AraC family transcriptional regulator [Vibrio cyclitrophicus]